MSDSIQRSAGDRSRDASTWATVHADRVTTRARARGAFGATGITVALVVLSHLPTALGTTMLPRDYSTGVQLIRDGSACCTIIHPAGEGPWPELARRVAEAIQALGAPQVEVLSDTQAIPERLAPIPERLRGRTLILLGDVNTNRAIFPLYANYYTCCDADYPGGAGYELRTIVRPFGWDVNYLLVGGSTQAGAAAGAERLIAVLKTQPARRNVELPYTLEVQLGPAQVRVLAPYLATADEDKPFEPPAGKGQYGQARDQFTGNAHLYFYTGRPVFARRASDWAIFLTEYDKEVPFFHSDDYRLQDLATAWRRVSCSPAFSAENRLRIDNRVYATIDDQATKWWREKDADRGIGMRHHTTGMLGWWTFIRLAQELGVPGPDADRQLRQWRTEAEDYLEGLLRHYWDDADDYQSADSIQNTASYALQQGRMEWFTSGLGRRAAERLLSVTDNRGWYAGIMGYGEALPGWEHFTLNGGLLLGSCAFVYQDGTFKWILERFPALQSSWRSLHPFGLAQFATGPRLEPRQPAWLHGSQVVRFTPYRLNLINTGDFLQTEIMDGYRLTGLAARPVSEELAFDKLVIRSRPEPDGSYLVLQGMAAVTLSTIDMNSIIRHTDRGKLWLLHNTARRSLYFKNGVYISRGLNDEPIPAACELIAQADFDRAALAASRLPDYRGTTWTRHLAALHNQYTLVIDQIRFHEPGRYVTCGTWRTPGFAVLHGNKWTSRQEEATFTLLSGPDVDLASERAPERDGATRPTVLRQSRSLDVQPGDDLFIESLLYSSAPGHSSAFEIRRPSPGTLLIRDAAADDGSASLHLAAVGTDTVSLGDLSTDASLLLLTPPRGYLAGGTHIVLAGRRIAAKDGAVTLDQADAAHVEALLVDLWNKGKTKRGAPAPEGSVQPGRRPVVRWTHLSRADHGPLIDGVRIEPRANVAGPTALSSDWVLPVLVAEPRLAPPRGTGLGPALQAPPSPCDQQATGQSASMTEACLSPAVGAEFFMHLPGSRRIGELALFCDPVFNALQPLPPAAMKVELAFSRDGFITDSRTREVTVPRELSYHNLYKGHAYLFECYRMAELDEEASAVRVRVLDAPRASMLLADVRVRSTEHDLARPVRIHLADLNNDGCSEILAWTPEGDLTAVTAVGEVLWQQHWPAGILAVDAWHVDGDDRPAVFVSRTDRWVTVCDTDGNTRWEADFRDMNRITDGRCFSDGNAIYGMVAWPPPAVARTKATCCRSSGTPDHVHQQVDSVLDGSVTRGPGRQILLLTGYFFAALFDAHGEFVECFRRDGHFTQSRLVPPGLANSGHLAMRSDIPWTGPVPLTWHSDDLKTPYAKCSVPNGPAVAMELADFDGDGSAEAIVVTEQGLGVYSAKPPHTRWEQMTDSPPVGVGVIPASGNGPPQIVYGREDGYLFVVAHDGRVIGSTLLDEPIRCLTALRNAQGEPIAVVGTAGALHAMNLPDFSPRWTHPAACQWVGTLTDSGNPAILAVTRTGELQFIDP